MTVRRPSIRILILEDDPDTALLIEEAITERFGEGCSETIAMLHEARDLELDEFDIVLCDFHLPDGNGLTALRNILSRRPDLPVIMVTSEREVSVVMDAIRTGAYDYMVKSDQMFDLIPLTIEKNLEVYRIKRENQRLQDDLARSFERIQESNAQLASLVHKLEEMAHTDALTGLCNRRHLNNTLNQMYAESLRYNTPLAAVMIDLDGFKTLNDTLGHQAGDDVLVHLGRLIRRNAREADVASRFGGDEFLLLMPQTDGETAAAFVHRIRREFTREGGATRGTTDEITGDTAHETTSPSLSIRFSVGIACTNVSAPNNGEHLITLADRALYAAKDAGKDRIMLCLDGGKRFQPLHSSIYRQAS